jgi:uncharacterized protein (TIGR02145 family)
LYDWYTVSTGKLCPIGWHVPSAIEWNILLTFLGGDAAAGGKLKATGISLWKSPNAGATNSSGFSALPGGERFGGNGQFYGIGQEGNWWSSTSNDTSYPVLGLTMTYDSNVVEWLDISKYNGLSVRCIKN